MTPRSSIGASSDFSDFSNTTLDKATSTKAAITIQRLSSRPVSTRL
jgi:hypothetical protein